MRSYIAAILAAAVLGLKIDAQLDAKAEARLHDHETFWAKCEACVSDDWVKELHCLSDNNCPLW